MRMTGAARAEQQHSVQGNHGKGRADDLAERSDAAVPPDVDGAGNAHRGEGDHEHTDPGVVVSRDGEPQVHQAGDSRESCAEPGMEDGPA